MARSVVPDPRGYATAVWTGSEMIVWGGLSETTPLGTGGRYDPATDTWTSIASGASAPSARNRHTAVWTGTQMIVWGGTDGGAYTNSGGRYDPLNDIWASTKTVNAPTGRAAHTAVWTGSVMVVWGGSWADGHSVHYVKTGGRYDPLSNAWAPTSISVEVT